MARHVIGGTTIDRDYPLATEPVSPAATAFFDGTADETVANIVAAPASLVQLDIANPDAAQYFLQLFDLLAADVILGTTAPVQSLLIPAGDGAGEYGSLVKSWANPLEFEVAISYAVTTTATGNTGPSTSVVLNAQYI